MYLWIWGQAIGSFFSHSLRFLLATVFESNRLRFPFRVTSKINISFGTGRGQWIEPLNFCPNCSLRRAISFALLLYGGEDRRKKSLTCGLFWSKFIVLGLSQSWSVPRPTLLAKTSHNQWEVSEHPGGLKREKVTHLSVCLSIHLSVIYPSITHLPFFSY